MSDRVSDLKKREYLPMILGQLVTRYAYTRDPETHREIGRFKAELAAVNGRLSAESESNVTRSISRRVRTAGVKMISSICRISLSPHYVSPGVLIVNAVFALAVVYFQLAGVSGKSQQKNQDRP